MNELKSCPFCGSEAYLRNHLYCWEVKCVRIGCDAVQRSADKDKAVDKWNRRAL